MKIAVLTTQTTHHAWFIRELMRVYKDVFCILETNSLKAKFETSHPFERERDQYELEALLDNSDTFIKDLCPCGKFESVNSPEVLKSLINFNPDLIVVFGTGKIKEDLVKTFKGRILNLHGGDPEQYRGLDSHLWAIYHNDFSNIATTIHHLDVELDKGDVITKKTLDLTKISQLHQLRALNTKVCLELTLSAISMLEKGDILSYKQKSVGRYYSFMPTSLKEICHANFSRFKKKNA